MTLSPPIARDLLFLQIAQQQRLEVRLHFTDLVQEMVPVCAISKRPGLPPFLAPVKAPSTYRTIRSPRRLAGSAAQFTATKGLSLRSLLLWMALGKQLLAGAGVPEQVERAVDARSRASPSRWRW
jgi:hypothetical protein